MITNIKEEINKIEDDFGKKLGDLNQAYEVKRANAKADRDQKINDLKSNLQEALSLLNSVNKKTIELKYQNEPRPRKSSEAVR